MEMKKFGIIIFIGCALFNSCHNEVIPVKYKSNINGRIFNGIGGISGGGATSKLLQNYQEPYRSQILDYLFKPQFGASLHMLKVEIGGDSQSTEGTEASHMHYPWDEDYTRGYEWWLMIEAKKRNPSILLYGLPWAYPGWVGEKNNPFKYPNTTALYVLKWISGAKTYYNLDIDYIGIWNERSYTATYIKTLRALLDRAGFTNTKIIAADIKWEISNDILKDNDLAKAVYGIGAHYPGTTSTSAAVQTGKPLWASEDYSTFNNDVGSGCWARILNQNYVNGLMTSTISWNLVASYYDDLPYKRCSLMTANEPWSGHYEVSGPVWITAHTTQFTKPGWVYLPINNGSGKLPKGGSYVSLVSSDNRDFTMIIETMTHDRSICIRPFLNPYEVEAQNVTFHLQGLNVNTLNMWISTLDPGKAAYFNYNQTIKVPSTGLVNLYIQPNTVITLSTLNATRGGFDGSVPASKPFPLPYSDDFHSYSDSAEPYMITPQVGSFEVSTNPGGDKYLVQTVQQQPIDWCVNYKPIALFGNYSWSSIHYELDVMVPSVNGTNGVFIGAWVDRGGCDSDNANGLFFWVFPSHQIYNITTDLQRKTVLKGGSVKFSTNTWNRLAIKISNGTATFLFSNTTLATASNLPNKEKYGFLAMGADNFGLAMYDNLSIQET